MPASVRYSETLRLQRSTLLRLAGVFSLSAVPLAVVFWLFWRPLGGVLVALGMTALAVTLWLTRWQLQVRPDGLYYRVVPLVPVWRSIAGASETVDVTVERTSNGRDTLGEDGALFPWSSGRRVVAADVDGGVRIAQASGTDVFVSSTSPDELASALRSVAR